LANYVSRLGAIINIINKEPDWDVKGAYRENDYVYKVYRMPVVRKLVWSEEKQAMVYLPNQTNLL
jgi:hypothetical protein